MKNLIRKVTDALGWTIPAFSLEKETNNKVNSYVPPEKLGMFMLMDTETKNRMLLQVEREMNPTHNHYGKEFVAVRPGNKWLRTGFYSANRDKCWVNLFKEFKDRKVKNEETGEEETKRTRIGEIVEAFVNCASKENGGSWGKWELEPYTPKQKVEA